MAYIYKHLRNDTNDVFYVGYGTDDGGKYKRAITKKSRNIHWKNIVNKVGFHYEIIEDNLTLDELSERERYWIKFYGRSDLNEGTLVNMTDGGDGGDTSGYIDYTKVSNSMKGRIFSDEHKNKLKGPKSEDTKLKLRKPHSIEHNKNVSKALTGRKLSKEHKEKIRQSLLIKNKLK